MYRSSLPARGIATASALAGPIFLAWIVIGGVYAQLPRAVPIPLDWGAMALSIPILVAATAFGLMLAILPATLESMAMMWIGARWPWTRRTAIWGAVGALLPLTLATVCGWPGTIIFGLAATGSTCAAICRSDASYCD